MPDPRTRRDITAQTGFFRSVRSRLLAIALLPMLVVLPLFLGAVVNNWSQRFDDLLIAKVNGELTIAHQYMFSILEGSGQKIQALAESAEFDRTMLAGNDTITLEFLDQEREFLGLDFLYITTVDGQELSSPINSNALKFIDWPVVKKALSGRLSSEIDIFSAAELARFSVELEEQARIKLVPTEAAVPTERLSESRGMVIHTAAPVRIQGRPAALVGGLLLNRNLNFIDTINDLVYPAASLTEGSRGTATLFLDDVRVSTNVRLFENVRALGTRVSAIVRSTVLDGGQVWLDRAFVVNDWYISAYEPIIDSHGDRVGMLYVGFLDTPFRAAKQRTVIFIVLGFLAIVALSIPVFLRWASSIINPLEKMVTTISKVEDGNLGARSKVQGGQDEISKVSGHLDGLLDQLQERDKKLRDWAGELNDRVAERTRELSDANQRIEATTKQLVISEKLAAIGEITAGIAHEINNPIAVIQGNLDVIRQEIGGDNAGFDTEFGLIYEQVHSVNVLVNKLLQFARPEEYAGTVDHHIPNDVINDSIPLVQHLLKKVDIELSLDLQADQPVAMNRTELQQVLINLIVNAIHAMPDGGQLALRSSSQLVDDIQGVLIEVSDTGSGMSAEILDSIFDPFFTTKRGDGTGLGLSISQDLVSRNGGNICATSKEGVGTSFTVWIPTEERG